MGLEALDAVQARIASIEQTVANLASTSPVGANTKAGQPDFASVLAQMTAANDGSAATGNSASTSTSTGAATGSYDPTAASNALGLNGSNSGIDSSQLLQALGGSTSSSGTDTSQLLQALGGGTSSSGTDLSQILQAYGASSGTAAPAGSQSSFVDEAVREVGKQYRFGAQASISDANPAAFDCSDLVRWAAGRSGVTVPDGSWNQYLDAKRKGELVPVDQALHTRGALLFSFSSEPTPGGGRPHEAHVAISLGDGRTIEARGRQYGVGEFAAGNRFQYAAVVPGLS